MWLGIPCPLSCLMTGGPGAHPMSIGSTWHFLTPISLSFWLRLPLQLLWRCAWTWGALFLRATAGPSHLSPFCWLQCIFLSPLGRFSLLSGVFPTVYFFLLWSSALGAQLLHPLWFLLHQLFSISLAGSSDPISPGFVCSAFCQWIFSIHPQAFCKMFWPLLQPFCKAWLSLQLLSLFARAGLSLLSPWEDTGYCEVWVLSQNDSCHFCLVLKKYHKKQIWSNLVKSGEIMFWPDLTRFWPDLTRLEKMKKHLNNLENIVPIWFGKFHCGDWPFFQRL